MWQEPMRLWLRNTGVHQVMGPKLLRLLDMLELGDYQHKECLMSDV